MNENPFKPTPTAKFKRTKDGDYWTCVCGAKLGKVTEECNPAIIEDAKTWPHSTRPAVKLLTPHGFAVRIGAWCRVAQKRGLTGKSQRSFRQEIKKKPDDDEDRSFWLDGTSLMGTTVFFEADLPIKVECPNHRCKSVLQIAGIRPK